MEPQNSKGTSLASCFDSLLVLEMEGGALGTSKLLQKTRLRQQLVSQVPDRASKRRSQLRQLVA